MECFHNKLEVYILLLYVFKNNKASNVSWTVFGISRQLFCLTVNDDCVAPQLKFLLSCCLPIIVVMLYQYCSSMLSSRGHVDYLAIESASELC